MNNNIIKALAVTAELTGTELSENALLVIEKDLSEYLEADVLRALNRCRRELSGRLTLAAIIERIQENDGRPGADEAWSIACTADDEGETVLWTAETEAAFAQAARPLLEHGDKIAARMAFKEFYAKAVREAREQRQPVAWKVSLGWDQERRRAVLSRALELGRLPAAYANGLMPPAQPQVRLDDVIAGGQLRLVSDTGKDMTAEDVAERIKKLKQLLKP